jgi:hypothetical protein
MRNNGFYLSIGLGLAAALLLGSSPLKVPANQLLVTKDMEKLVAALYSDRF